MRLHGHLPSEIGRSDRKRSDESRRASGAFDRLGHAGIVADPVAAVEP